MNLSRVATIVLAAFVLASLPAFAEPPINFTGTWQLDRSRSVLPSSIPSSGDLTVIIDHKGDTLTIERHAKFMGKQITSKSTYYTDGREVSNTTPRGQKVLSKSHWEGNTLVTVSRGTTVRNGQTDEGTDIKKLEDGGKVMVVDVTLKRPGKEPEKGHAVYIKK